MSCEYGHSFQPFERSRDLYCSACGLVKNSAPVRQNQASSGIEKLDTTNLGRMQLPSDPLPSDPHRDQALAILEAAKNPNPDFEDALRAIFERYELPPDIAQDMFSEGMAFGSNLDLEDFEKRIIAPLAAVKHPQPIEDALDEGFEAS